MVLRGEFCKNFIAFVIETKIFSLEVFMKIKTSKLLVVLCVVATMVLALVPMFALTTAAADTEVVFELGANGSAAHKDGSSNKTTYSETVGDYTLSLTGGTNMYPSSYDAKGNSCIKLGSSSKTGGFSFTVPDDVTSVVIAIAKYKANTTKITVNGTAYTLSNASNDGAYDAIEVDTTSTKTVTLTTVSGGVRAMVNTITYVIEPAGDPECQHTNTEAIGEAKGPTCTETGITAGVKCSDCGFEITPQEDIPATGHTTVGTGTVTPPTCTEKGYTTYTCEVCGTYTANEVAATGHNYVDGECDVCGEAEPTEATLTFDNTTKCTESSTTKQVWFENGITLTNNKASSTTSVAVYAPARFYASSEIVVEVEGNITSLVFVCNSSDYASTLKSSITNATVTVNGVTVTITPNTPASTFTIAKLSAQVRVNSLTVSYFYVAPACTHTNTEGIGQAKDPTCTETGITAGSKCADCGEELDAQEILPILGHNYVDGKCERCEKDLPVFGNLSFATTDNRTELSNEKQVWMGDGFVLTNDKAESTNAVADYCNPARFYKSSVITIDFTAPVYQIVFNCSSSSFAEALLGAIDGATQNGSVITVVFAEPVTSFEITVTAATRINSITVAYGQAEISQAAVNAGVDLSVLFNVTIADSEDIADYKMNFTFNSKVYTATSEDGIFVLNGIAPQMMGENITVELVDADGNVVDTKDFTIKAYLEGIVADENDEYSEKLEALASALLAYGQAAENYVNKVEPSTTVDVTDVEVPAGDRTLSLADGKEYDANVTFKSFGVSFDYVNKVYFKITNTNDADITVYIDGVEATIVDGTVYTDAISATDFDKVFTATLYVDGELYQTVTYSVNSYAAAKWDSTTAYTSELARAMYLYGLAANELA